MFRHSALFLLLCPPALFAQGNLNRTRSQMADLPIAPKPAEPAPARQVDSSTVPNGSAGDAYGYAFLGAGILATSPLWLPPLLLDDNLFRPGYFPGHPYAHEQLKFIDPGERQFAPAAEMDWFDPVRYKPWSVRLGVENGNDFGGLNRAGARLAVDTAYRIGLTLNGDYFHERLPCGCVDEAWMGEINLVYRFAQSDWLQMHSGLGVRILTGKGDTFGGFNFTYGADVFPIEPVVVSAQVDLGTLHEAFVVRARATVGWQIKRLELFGGYDFLRIGEVNFQGPLLGARLWF